MSEEIRIYVACLAAYNNGRLHGVWIDATDDIDDIQDQINEMLESSPEEEQKSGQYMITRVMVLIGCQSMKVSIARTKSRVS